MHETGTVEASLSNKITGTVTFTFDTEEPIRKVQEFVLMVHRDTEVGFASFSARKSALDVLMNSSISFCVRDGLMKNVSEIVFITNGLLPFSQEMPCRKKSLLYCKCRAQRTLGLLSTHQMWADLICVLNLLEEMRTH